MLPITSETAPPDRPSSIRLCRVCILVASVVGLAVLVSGGGAAPPTEPSDKEPTLAASHSSPPGRARGKQKPDAAIILTGQTFGLLQPCGCSRPQRAGSTGACS